MNIEELKMRKTDLGMTNRDLARKSGIPLSTVAKILGGTTKTPRIDTVQALEKALQGKDNGGDSVPGDRQTAGCLKDTGAVDMMNMARDRSNDYVCGSNAEKQTKMTEEKDILEKEAGMGDPRLPDTSQNIPGQLYGYSAQSRDGLHEIVRPAHYGLLSGEPLHTIEEYLALPDDRRVEMIDGRFYDMASPSGVHQQICLLIWKTLDDCIEEHGMLCRAQAAPFDVQLDDHTIVMPDVMVFCEDPSQVFAARAMIPPDLVIEVLSRSTAFRDRHLKLFKYQKAGVKELWLVSPERQNIEVYLFTEGREEPDIYTFEDTVPVRISEGRCSVDFAKIRKRLPPV